MMRKIGQWLMISMLLSVASCACAADSAVIGGSASIAQAACPNLPGYSLPTPPAGMVVDAMGNCVPGAAAKAQVPTTIIKALAGKTVYATFNHPFYWGARWGLPAGVWITGAADGATASFNLCPAVDGRFRECGPQQVSGNSFYIAERSFGVLGWASAQIASNVLRVFYWGCDTYSRGAIQCIQTHAWSMTVDQINSGLKVMPSMGVGGSRTNNGSWLVYSPADLGLRAPTPSDWAPAYVPGCSNYLEWSDNGASQWLPPTEYTC